MMYIPKRSNLEYCWVATRSVVSIYFSSSNAFVELDNSRTLRLTYETTEDAQRAVACFCSAMCASVSKEEADNSWPKPTHGDILRMM
jgi:hypothetical protein